MTGAEIVIEFVRGRPVLETAFRKKMGDLYDQVPENKIAETLYRRT